VNIVRAETKFEDTPAKIEFPAYFMNVSISSVCDSAKESEKKEGCAVPAACLRYKYQGGETKMTFAHTICCFAYAKGTSRNFSNPFLASSAMA
jgi:hypothetical protein